MATKRQANPETADKQLAGAVRDSAEQIWLAGLGAFAKAQEEGSKVFEALVQEGHQLQRRTRAVTEERIEEVAGRFTEAASHFTRQASQSWDKLEQLFEDRVARALSRLGVPSPRDIRELTGLLETLSDRIEALDSRIRPAAGRNRARAGAASGAANAAKPLTPSAGTTTAKATGAAKATKASKASKATKASKAAGAGDALRASKASKASKAPAAAGIGHSRPE